MKVDINGEFVTEKSFGNKQIPQATKSKRLRERMTRKQDCYCLSREPRERINFEKEFLENTEANLLSTPSPPKPLQRRKLDSRKQSPKTKRFTNSARLPSSKLPNHDSSSPGHFNMSITFGSILSKFWSTYKQTDRSGDRCRNQTHPGGFIII
jgi:hypothetical protein